MLVQERARRATAGNRMAALLEQQEVNPEEMFSDADDDVEFEQREGASHGAVGADDRGARLCRL